MRRNLSFLDTVQTRAGYYSKCFPTTFLLLQAAPQRLNHSSHGTPVHNNANNEGSDFSSLGKEVRKSAEHETSMQAAEEYTKLLRRRMISEVLQKPHNNDIWQLQLNSERNSRPSKGLENGQAKKNKHHRRSHSAQGTRKSSETQSEVNVVKPVVSPKKPGLGRRSATQLELSRRKRNEEDVTPALRKMKWHSQEHLDTTTTTTKSTVRSLHHF